MNKPKMKKKNRWPQFETILQNVQKVLILFVRIANNHGRYFILFKVCTKCVIFLQHLLTQFDGLPTFDRQCQPGQFVYQEQKGLCQCDECVCTQRTHVHSFMQLDEEKCLNIVSNRLEVA